MPWFLYVMTKKFADALVFSSKVMFRSCGVQEDQEKMWLNGIDNVAAMHELKKSAVMLRCSLLSFVRPKSVLSLGEITRMPVMATALRPTWDQNPGPTSLPKLGSGSGTLLKPGPTRFPTPRLVELYWMSALRLCDEKDSEDSTVAAMTHAAGALPVAS